MRTGLPLVALACVMILAPAAWAWGPHPAITQAALQVLPEADHWKQVLGDQFGQLTNYCWLPDVAGEEWGDFYTDDYLLIRGIPRYAGHGAPYVNLAWRPFFLRALQGLRTETPANAARQMGPLIHYVEDTGAPPHTGVNFGALHGPLENWVKANEIVITGYVPQLLGADEASALAGLTTRLEALSAFSLQRVNRAKPLAEQGEAARPQVEPILLESALESARAVADVLHTLFTLADAPVPPGAGLRGTIATGPFHPGAPAATGRGARVMLLSDEEVRALDLNPASLTPALTDYATVAYAATPQPAGPTWRGRYEFRNLPSGTYRVWAYRPGSLPCLSAPVTLTVGQVTEADLTLTPDDPPGNIIQNPHATIAVLSADPDRWTCRAKTQWTSRSARLVKGLTYRCGGVLKDPAAKITMVFSKGPNTPAVTQELPAAQPGAAPPEITYACTEDNWRVTVTVETTRPLTEALDRVWVVPAPPANPGG